MIRSLSMMGFVFCLLLAESASAQLPGGMQFDDGFSYYSITSDRSMERNRPVNRYYVTAYARIIGANMVRDSAFRFTYKQGRRTLGTVTCTGQPTYRNEYLPSNQSDGFTVANCNNSELYFDVTGAVEVEVHFIDDATDGEYLAATHTLDVLELKHENDSGQPRPSQFVVNQHGWGGVVFLDQVPRGDARMFTATNGLQQGGSSPESQLQLIVQHTGSGSLSEARLRCSVDGERLDFGYGRVRSDGVRDRSTAHYQHPRDADNSQAQHLIFQTVRYRLPIYFGERQVNGGGVRLEDHPGHWDCALRDSERRTVRAFAFDVRDGRVQPHAEEAAGDLHFPDGVHLADMTWPGPNGIDQRSDPAMALSAAFYGRGWQTDAGRAMAGRVAQIGDAYPSTIRRRAARRQRRQRRRR